MKLDCRRINLFIGEPNTGKSNILEALGFLSHLYGHGGRFASIRDFIRMEDMTNLFYERDYTKPIKISVDEKNIEVRQSVDLLYVYADGIDVVDYNLSGEGYGYRPIYQLDFPAVNFYRFKIMRTFPEKFSEFLLPPHGDNLLKILVDNKELRRLVGDIFGKYGLKLVLKPLESRMEVMREAEGIAISYPYDITSETLQRLIFHFCAVKTVKNATITFEEPEAHSFPYYTKYLAELIALNKDNQFFISTHNPYFLLSVVEKAPKEDTAVFLTYYEDYQTKVKLLKHEDILELEHDIFFELPKILKKG